MKALCAILTFLSASVLGQVDSIPDKRPADIARAAFPFVVLLAMHDGRGQPLSLGSGFFVEKNIVAPNFHVIDGAAGGYAKIIGQPAKLTIEGIVGLDAVHDLALLQLTSSSAPDRIGAKLSSTLRLTKLGELYT